MFTFIKQYTEKMKGAQVYAFISLFIFFIFFIALLLYAIKMRKEKVKELSNIPFDEGDLNKSSGN